ncbi:ABC transporter permease [Robertmurraya yapensis]|uniref:ABC transporter permease n=1 Tax=Bacillus yapensis TaxID=2492960 RepID=A0A431WL07_9BACI|nr:FtsX-like permease family protein [Bacillus yapensis]RTR36096.1 ABC transporter permease [Bacillus yapensis]TKT05599.1 FtsX-like permease family protein [Bacillus yapensis]
MAILKIIIRKILNNRWLVGSLFLGLLITSSLVSSIPTYSSSVLSKLLLKELEDYQVKNDKYPGEYSYLIQLPSAEEDQKSLVNELKKTSTNLTNEVNLPIEATLTMMSTAPLAIAYEDPSQASLKEQKFGSILSFSDLKKHIEITDGNWPNAPTKDGIYEVLVPESALKKRDIVLNTTFLAGKGNEQIVVKPVGTFKAKDERDPYWFTSPDSYNEDFFLPEEIFETAFVNGDSHKIESIRFYTAFDYHAVTINQLESLVGMEKRTKAAVSELTDGKLIVNFPAQNIITSYFDKSGQLRTMLWSLNVPLFIMLGIYLYMVTKLIIDRQRNEIAILNSRGAKRVQILLIYLIEIGLLATVAFLMGPFLGLWLCKILGATNGFLEFVQRSSLQTKLLKESFLYSFLAVIACIFMMMIPIYQASKQNIVHHKRTAFRVVGNVGWYTVFIEIALLGISVYGWTIFNRRQKELLAMGDTANSFTVDPLLFFVPAAFIIGLGLLTLRIYPFLLKGINRLGKKYFSLSFYSTLIQVSRSAKQYLYLMLFLILTIAVGVFSASAARTINNNLEEQIRYGNGADVAVQVRWDSVTSGGVSSPVGPTGSPSETSTENQEAEEAVTGVRETIYAEPPYDPFLKLKSAEHVTKVFQKEDVTIDAKGESISSVNMMAIDSKDFGETAWFKPSLLSHHWYQYLNLLAKEPSAVLLSKTAASNLGVKEGDYLTISSNGTTPVEFVVYGIIDYWPGFNPLQTSEDKPASTLVVANLSYVQNMIGLEPYEVWLKVKEDATRETLYEELKETGLPLTNVADVQPQLVEMKNSAFLLGINGTLSLGFLISIMVTFIGFLIYWILTMKSRSLQYGIYRAMGIPLRQLIAILLYEQLLTSGIACALGIGIGGITSTLFVPMFQLSFNPKDVVPPFQVVFDAGDEWTIYGFVLVTLLIGLSILAIILKNIRISQAIKLGED